MQIRKRFIKKHYKKTIVDGVKFFYVGTHGEFDEMVLSVCCELKREYEDIKIFVVLTNISKKTLEHYSDCGLYETIIFNIEEIYYKRRIEYSNKIMVERSDVIICFLNVSTFNSGTQKIIKYAKKLNKPIINVFNTKN